MATAKKIYVGQKAKTFDTSPRKAGYDMVVMLLDDNNYITSPAVRVSNASAWDSRDNGEYKFTYTESNSKWRTPFNTYANAAALTSNYGLTLVYGNATSPKAGDVITVNKTTVNNTQSVTAALSRSGNVLEFECPLVKPEQRQQIADKILQSVAGYEYQPYSASGVHLEPATEIGDAITAFGVLGGIYDKNTQYGRLSFSDIASTWYEESEEETGYQSAIERKYSRRFAETSAELSILADRISSAVSDSDFNSAIEQLSDEISAKVSGSGGNANSFAWSLDTTGFTLYANGAQVFKCDRSGITVNGNGTFTGEVYAANIRSDAVDHYGGSLSGSAITGGTLGAVQCTTGVQESLGYADLFNLATQNGTQTYPEYFTASAVYAIRSVTSKVFSVEDAQGIELYKLNGHYHSFAEVDGKIVCGAPNNSANIDGRSFRIAATQTYINGVAAATVAAQEVITADSNTIRDYTTGFDCDLTGKTYTPSGSTNQFGRINIKNAAGEVLKKIRVQLPAGAAGSISSATVQPSTDTINDIRTDSTTLKVYLKTLVKGYSSSSSTTPIFNQDNVECDITTAADFIKNVYQTSSANVLTTDDSNYRTYDTGYSWGTRLYNPNLSTGGSSVYGRVGLYNSSNSLLKTYRFALSMSIQSASTSSDPSDYYQSGGHWYLKVHVKNSTTEIYQGAVDVQQAVDIGASSAGTQYQLYCTNRTENSAGLVTCDFSISSYNGLPWRANNYYTFRY